MKNTRYLVASIVCFVGLLGCGKPGIESFKNEAPNPVSSTERSPRKPQTPWKASLEEVLASREYAIQWQDDQCAYSSPNRQNNLRITYHDNGFSIKPRVDSSENWRLQYIVDGVYRSGRRLISATEAPQNKVHENHLRQDFDQGFHILYENTPLGMRQNFLLDYKPAGLGPLRLKIHTKGSLFPEDKGNNAIVLAEKNPVTGLMQTRVWYKDLLVLDASGEEIPARMEVGEPEYDSTQGEWLAMIDIVVEDGGASYPLLIDPISTTAAVTVEINQAGANFGYSVSSAGDVNGDGYSDVIIGAPFYDNGQSNEGAAFIFHGSTTGISTSPASVIESNQANANMGNSVGTAADVNGDGYSDVIVGAPLYDNGQSDEGAAFIYYGSAAGIMLSPYTIVEGNQANAKMGNSARTAGDVNGDHFADIVCGAELYDNGQLDEGVAFVILGSISGIDTNSKVLLEYNQPNSSFGKSIGAAGDVNGDGYFDVIVGAPFYESGQTDEGAAFLFHGSATGINTSPAAMLQSNQAFAGLGWSVNTSGDVNGDGFSDVLVGAINFDNGQTDEGAAFVYHGSPLGIIPTVISTLESNQASANMGQSVRLAGDVNGDGHGDILVGASNYDNGQSNEGAAFLYLGSSAGINGTQNIRFESNQANAGMGMDVASAGDVNGDGYSDIIVGATLFDHGQTDEGSVFLYHGQASGISIAAFMTMEVNQTGAIFGSAVAGVGDVNGDGFSDIAVGAPLYDNGQSNEGAAFIYYGAANGPNAVPATILEGNQASAYFGYSVNSAGDVNGDGFGDIIIGAHSYDNGETDEGAAFVYLGSVSGIQPSSLVTIERNQSNAAFGFSVACAGDVNGDGYSDVIVGAQDFDFSQNQEGGAFIYHGGPNGIGNLPAWSKYGGQANAFFGISVASAGDVDGDGFSDVIVGAPNYDFGEVDEGAAFVYYGSSGGILANGWDRIEENQPNGGLGNSVSSAGDVNGDGFGDVLVGASQFSLAQPGEGAAMIYYGFSNGISSNRDLVRSNQANASMGSSVASAGDVNGDGFSDIIVGVQNYDNPQIAEGAAFIYHGSPIGIGSAANIVVESNQIAGQLGESVASAGDVNGDGYSDIIVGAPGYTNGETEEGRAYIYFGNGGSGLVNGVQQMRANSTIPISPGGLSGALGQVQYVINGKSYIGRQGGKMAWETRSNGIPFAITGGTITNSLASTGVSSSYTDLAGTGTLLIEVISGLNQTKDHKWRCRIQYDPVTAITGQIYGPWYYHKSRTPEVPMLGFKAFSLCSEEVNLLGNAISISDGDLSPSTTDHTDFGAIAICGGSIVRSFAIQNTGSGSLFVTGMNISGANAADFTVSVPPSTSVNGGSSTTFQIAFSPTAMGVRNAMINFTTNDCNESAYNFAIRGIGNPDMVTPVIICPASFTVVNDPGLCSKVVSYSAPTGSDNCGNAMISQLQGIASGSTFPVGATQNIFRVTDVSGNSSTCSFSVVVSDIEAPTISCPANIIGNNDLGLCTKVVAYNLPNVTDNCPSVTVTQLQGLPTNSIFPIGSTTNAYLATDGAGNSASCAFTITILDNELPVITCPANSIVGTDTTACSAVFFYPLPQVTDNCAISNLTQTAGFSSGAVFPIGTTVNTYEVVDAAGNTNSCTFSIIVEDNVAPIADCQNVSVILDSTGTASISASAIDHGSNDNCGIAGMNLNVNSFSCATTGANTVTLTVIDVSGNSSTCAAQVTVLGPPTTAIANADTIHCGYHISCFGAQDGIAHASANGGCPGYTYLWSDGQPTATAVGLGVGSYSVTVTDASGGTSTSNVTVIAPDPILLIGNVTNTCIGDSSGEIDLQVTGGNDCSSYSFAWSNAATTEDLSNLPSGTYSVTVTDVEGCSQSQTFAVGTFPLPVPSFTQVGIVLISSQAWSSYQWLLNGNPISGATASTYSIFVTGTYSLMVTDSNGCSGTSNGTLVTGINSGFGNEIDLSLFPNPTRDEFRLRSMVPITEALVVGITDMFGRRIFETKLQELQTEAIFDIRGIAAGTYLVDVVLESGRRQVFRLVIQ